MDSSGPVVGWDAHQDTTTSQRPSNAHFALPGKALVGTGGSPCRPCVAPALSAALSCFKETITHTYMSHITSVIYNILCNHTDIEPIYSQAPSAGLPGSLEAPRPPDDAPDRPRASGSDESAAAAPRRASTSRGSAS